MTLFCFNCTKVNYLLSKVCIFKYLEFSLFFFFSFFFILCSTTPMQFLIASASLVHYLWRGSFRPPPPPGYLISKKLVRVKTFATFLSFFMILSPSIIFFFSLEVVLLENIGLTFQNLLHHKYFSYLNCYNIWFCLLYGKIQ